MNTQQQFSNVIFFIILGLLAAWILRIEQKGIIIKFLSPTVTVVLFAVLSVLLTSSGETIVARFFSLQTVVLVLVASVIFYGIALSVNNTPNGGYYIPIVFIAFGWNALNTVITGVFALYVDPRFAHLNVTEKLAFAGVVVLLIGAGFLSNYVRTALEKIALQ